MEIFRLLSGHTSLQYLKQMYVGPTVKTRKKQRIYSGNLVVPSGALFSGFFSRKWKTPAEAGGENAKNSAQIKELNPSHAQMLPLMSHQCLEETYAHAWRWHMRTHLLLCIWILSHIHNSKPYTKLTRTQF